jgi:hypothetical protein
VSTGNFTSASWEADGKVVDALIHCTVIQLGPGIPEFGDFPSFIRSQCTLPIRFDNGDFMFWHGVETIDPMLSPPLGGSKVPYAIEGGTGEWVGAVGEGLIQCEFFNPPKCSATGVVCKSDDQEVIAKMLAE